MRCGRAALPERGSQFGEDAVLWRKQRLVLNRELHDIAAHPRHQNDVLVEHREITAKIPAHYEEWRRVEPIGSPTRTPSSSVQPIGRIPAWIKEITFAVHPP